MQFSLVSAKELSGNPAATIQTRSNAAHFDANTSFVRYYSVMPTILATSRSNFNKNSDSKRFYSKGKEKGDKSK